MRAGLRLLLVGSQFDGHHENNLLEYKTHQLASLASRLMQVLSPSPCSGLAVTQKSFRGLLSAAAQQNPPHLRHCQVLLSRHPKIRDFLFHAAGGQRS